VGEEPNISKMCEFGIIWRDVHLQSSHFYSFFLILSIFIFHIFSHFYQFSAYFLMPRPDSVEALLSAVAAHVNRHGWKFRLIQHFRENVDLMGTVNPMM
jgi:hypothetical protein